jgi:peptide/nickel transport system ATP-binding protein
MNTGRVVESGVPTDILDNPKQAYTRELMAAIPTVGERWGELAEIDRKFGYADARHKSAVTHQSITNA